MEPIETSILPNADLTVQKMEFGPNVNKFIHPFRMMIAGIKVNKKQKF